MVDRCISSHHSSATYPSFSSTLLDAIYRSIDDSVETETLPDHNRHEPPAMKLNPNNLSLSENYIFKEEIVANYQRACMIEKWMAKTKIDRESRKPTSVLKAKASRKFRDENLSSNSSSSDHHQYYFSSSEPESYHVLNPKQVRTGCSGFDKVEKIFVTNREIRSVRLGEGSEQIPKQEGDDVFLKTKSRALKIYGDLMKVKQPISPGAKITGFLSLLFSYKNPKKKMQMKDTAEIVSDNNDSPSVKSTSTNTSTTCSSASSFSRSCLSKTPSSDRKSSNNSALTRSVRFATTPSIITDEDSKSHGHNKALDQDDKHNYCKKTPDDDEFSSKSHVRNVELMAARVMEKSHLFDRGDSDEEDDDDDAASYESSDLFELDNLSSIGLMDGDELPVYETTRLQM